MNLAYCEISPSFLVEIAKQGASGNIIKVRELNCTICKYPILPFIICVLQGRKSLPKWR